MVEAGLNKSLGQGLHGNWKYRFGAYLLFFLTFVFNPGIISLVNSVLVKNFLWHIMFTSKKFRVLCSLKYYKQILYKIPITIYYPTNSECFHECCHIFYTKMPSELQMHSMQAYVEILPKWLYLVSVFAIPRFLK